jgi:hypothetical protein
MITGGWRVHAELKAGTGVWTYCANPACPRRHFLYRPFQGVVEEPPPPPE